MYVARHSGADQEYRGNEPLILKARVMADFYVENTLRRVKFRINSFTCLICRIYYNKENFNMS